ncbi:GntR family transcriptional regulator [Rhizobium sp.]|jgi:DNA-binding GntR family transcriptional regulator|uniref:GntR family transcriptional regulator n=1 Tax=Rhizobium sp. TaxID=391 RepID=UPI000E948A88|nr:GntR family transcriptional regulator [Rhizobium sp.]
MKTNALYKRTYNQCLDLLASYSPGAILESEPKLAAALGVSRTTLRSVLNEMARRRIIEIDGRRKQILRKPDRKDYIEGADLEPLAAMVERKFMAWMSGPEFSPGKLINGLDLARQFGVSNSAIRDCLSTFSHFGLLRRQSNGRWSALGLTVDFVAELFDMREVMELRAVEHFVDLPPAHEAWKALSLLEKQHITLLHSIETQYRDFQELDDRFHRLVNSVAPNRFLANIQGVMSMIFHYHYQWNKKDEKERNHVAVEEHLAYIKGLQSRDLKTAQQACRMHLQTARATLLSSIQENSAPETTSRSAKTKSGFP